MSFQSPSTPASLRVPTPCQLDVLKRLAGREQRRGNFDTANVLFNFVRQVRPNDHEAEGGLVHGLFMVEDWDNAWEAYSWRFALPVSWPTVRKSTGDGRSVEMPRWSGKGALPKSLLVMDEQGAGDTILSCRFLADLVDRGIEIFVVAKPKLRALLASMGLPVHIIPAQSGTLSGIDAWTAMMDLPRVLGLKPKDYARTVPYFRTDRERAVKWRERIGTHGFRIGLAWQGSSTYNNDAKRSVALETLASFSSIEGVRLISLQKGFGEDQIETCSFRDKLENLGPDFDAGPDAFLDTAAVMDSLDLIISVDTSVAHLAGALGRPVSLLLHDSPDWRWLARRHDTVWYPTMRLYRQTRAGDWSHPVQQCARDIRMHLGQIIPAIEPIHAPISAGELLDKITILSIKQDRIMDPDKQVNVARELSLLSELRAERGLESPLLDETMKELRQVNETLWDVEDRLREHETRGDFGPDFVELARSVYVTNDRRAALKKSIDQLTGSTITEEKSYKG